MEKGILIQWIHVTFSNTKSRKAHLRGCEPYTFWEIEFYLVEQATGVPIDTAGYCSLPPEDKSYESRQELGRACKALVWR